MSSSSTVRPGRLHHVDGGRHHGEDGVVAGEKLGQGGLPPRRHRAQADERRAHPPVPHLGAGRGELRRHAVELAEPTQHGRQRGGVGALPQREDAVGDAEQVEGVQQPRTHAVGQAVLGRQEPVG